LAGVLELYSRRVIGWAIVERTITPLVCDALMMALWRHRMPKGGLFILIEAVNIVQLPTRIFFANTN
jgi:transposase InsO family protein